MRSTPVFDRDTWIDRNQLHNFDRCSFDQTFQVPAPSTVHPQPRELSTHLDNGIPASIGGWPQLAQSRWSRAHMVVLNTPAAKLSMTRLDGLNPSAQQVWK